MRRLICVCLILAILAALVAVPHPTYAQSTNASLTGRVLDPQGAVVPGVQIKVTSYDKGVSYAGETNSDGIYHIPVLPPGLYRMDVSKVGFRVIIKPDVVLNVQDVRVVNFTLQLGSVQESVTVEGGAPLVNTTDATVSTVVDRQFAENLPMNGRSFQTLIQLTPGVVITTSSALSDGQFSVNGQRADSNYWMVDGVSANIGMSSSPGATDTLSGSLGGFSAQGGTSSLVSIDALQEFRIQTSTFAPEFGRTPGGQISIVTRSGTNQFHGTVFDYFRNDVLDANDWFNGYINQPPLPKAEERQNDFGGTLSGPILKNRTFFFFSYEGMRLRLPQTELSSVPDNASVSGGLNSRENAPPGVRPFFNAYPVPNGPEILDSSGNPTGTASFNASYSNRSTLNATSLRVDHRLHDNLMLFARYNYAPSDLVARPGALNASDALSVLNTIHIGTQTATGGLTWTASPTLTNDFRANYSRVDSSQITSLDNFGGAVPFPSSAVALPSPYTRQDAEIGFYIGSISGPGLTGPFLDSGGLVRNLFRQWNLVDSLSVQKSTHSLKFGVDYRRLTPSVGFAPYQQVSEFFSLADAESNTTDFGVVQLSARVPLIFQNLALFGQDTWKVRPNLTLTYGLRWDVDFTPKTSSGPSLPTVTNFNDTSTLAVAPLGTPVFGTRYGNIEPRIGVAYQVAQKPGWTGVLRGGWGLFYDLATTEFQASGNAYPFGAAKFIPGVSLPLDNGTATPPPISPLGATVFAYDPKLRSPYTQEWNVAFEQSLGSAQSFSASYVGAVGRNLLLSEGFVAPNANIFLATLVGNYGTSDYHAFQLQFQRRLSRGLQALASYSWAHSIDTGSTGAGGLTNGDFYARQAGGNANRGPSDYDIRNQASMAFTYDIPSPKFKGVANGVLQHWSIDNVFQAHSAPPVDVSYGNFSTFASSLSARPDVYPGIPLYLSGSQYPGGKALNYTAGAVAGGCSNGLPSVGPFCPPPLDPTSGLPTRQGDLGRNALRGFGAWQWDFAAHRDFPMGEKLKLQFRAEMFNLLNHPNFGSPLGNVAVAGFGLSYQTLAQSLNVQNHGSGGFSPLYQFGGPRSVQFALKLSF